MDGYCGQILRVELTVQKCVSEPLNRPLIEGFIGGRGFAARFMYDEIEPQIEPLSEGNKIFIFTGPINGTAIPYSSRYVIATKSPLTRTYTRSLSGGQFSAILKYAGYDGIVIQGVSLSPSYLWIEDGTAEIRDAAHLWEKTTEDTEKWLKNKFQGSDCLCIGPAGEKQVLFSSVMNDWGRAAGRGGIGAVFGSKNLKAIAVRGKKGISVSDPRRFMKLLKESYDAVKTHPDVPSRIWAGTTGTVEVTNELGIIPAYNFSGKRVKGAENLYTESFRKKMVVHDEACFSCPLPCGKMAVIRSGPYQGTVVQGPQFETIGLLGTNCGITSLETVAKANSICNLGGLDTVEAGNVIGFAMECFEKGHLTKADTSDIDLRFGNGEALIAALEAIVEQNKFGKLLGRGAQGLAEILGSETAKFAMVSKGQGFAAYDPRALVGMGLLYATSPTGANHSTGPTLKGEMNLGLETNEGKAELVFNNQNTYCLMDSMVICAFSRYGLDNDKRRIFLETVTGKQFDTLKIAEKIFALERLFNVREGFYRLHDKLPSRSTEEPLPNGPSKGNMVFIDDLLDRYYMIRRWDHNGIPTKSGLKKLGLENEVDEFQGFDIKLSD